MSDPFEDAPNASDPMRQSRKFGPNAIPKISLRMMIVSTLFFLSSRLAKYSDLSTISSHNHLSSSLALSTIPTSSFGSFADKEEDDEEDDEEDGDEDEDEGDDDEEDEEEEERRSRLLMGRNSRSQRRP